MNRAVIFISKWEAPKGYACHAKVIYLKPELRDIDFGNVLFDTETSWSGDQPIWDCIDWCNRNKIKYELHDSREVIRKTFEDEISLGLRKNMPKDYC